MQVTHVIGFMIATLVGFIAVDVCLHLDPKEGNTYSEILRSAGRKWAPLIMIICFAFGLLAGHWWW